MGGITLRQTQEEYKSIYMAARNFAEKTRVEYAYDIEELVSFLEKAGVERVGKLSLPVLERYLADLDRRGVAGSTRKRKVVSIRSFLTFLYQDEYLSVNLARRIIPPHAEYKNPRFLTEAEYKRLLEASAHSLRDFAIIQLLLQTGIKLSELTRLTVNDVELPAALFSGMNEVGYLQIRGSERQKERIIPINYKACLALDEYLKRRPDTKSPALFNNRFGKGLGPRGVEKIVSKYCERARIEGVSVHSLRHTFGVHHTVKGTRIETIQEVMGLKDIRSTSIYVSLAQELVKKELQKNAL